ncbi:MAG: sensor protein pilS, partial [Marinobacter sp. T13-3]
MAAPSPTGQTIRSPFGPIAGMQQIRLFRIYNHYRLVISLMLTGLLFVDPFATDSRLRWEDYYQAGIFCYLAINVFIGLLMMAGLKPRERHISLSILADIAILHFLLLT